MWAKLNWLVAFCSKNLVYSQQTIFQLLFKPWSFYLKHLYDVLIGVTMSSPGESAPKFPSLWDSVWRRSSAEGWRRWESTECPVSQLTSRRWRPRLIRVSSIWGDTLHVGWTSVIQSNLYFFVLYWLLSPLPCRQQGCVCHDEGDGRKRHRWNTEAVFPRAAGASFHRWAVPKLCWRHRSVAASLTFLSFQVKCGCRLWRQHGHMYFSPCSSLWQCGQGELHAQPAAVSTRAQSGDLHLPARPP